MASKFNVGDCVYIRGRIRNYIDPGCEKEEPEYFVKLKHSNCYWFGESDLIPVDDMNHKHIFEVGDIVYGFYGDYHGDFVIIKILLHSVMLITINGDLVTVNLHHNVKGSIHDAIREAGFKYTGKNIKDKLNKFLENIFLIRMLWYGVH